MGLQAQAPYPYPSKIDSIEDVRDYLSKLYRALVGGEAGYAENLEYAFQDNWAFKTITGITNDVVADQKGDTLTLAKAGPLTIVGTAATDTITWTWAHLGIESLADPGADRIAFWDDGETAMKWLAPDGTTIEISGTTLQVLAGGLDHGTLAGLGDDDHSSYPLVSNFEADRATIATNWTDLTDAGATALHKHDHGGMDGLGDDDHTIYILHSLADAENDFLVASGANTFVKQTLAATGAILEGDIDHGNIQGLSTGADHSYINQDVQTTASPAFVTAKLSDLTDGYVPYHVSDAAGLANSGIFWDSVNSKVGINQPAPATTLHIAGGDLTIQGAANISRVVFKDSDGNIDGYFYADTGWMGIVDADGQWAIVTQNNVWTRLRVNGATGLELGADLHIDIYDWNDSVMREVSFGADDSGGSGYKVLRVPN